MTVPLRSSPPTRRRAEQAARFLSSLALLALIGLALPAAALLVLNVRFGSPHPFAGVTSPANWDAGEVFGDLAEPWTDGAVVDVLVRLSALLVLTAALIVVVTTALELVHVVRHRGLHRPTVGGLGWAQSIARYIAIGLLVAVPLATRASFAATSAPLLIGPADGPKPAAVTTFGDVDTARSTHDRWAPQLFHHVGPDAGPGATKVNAPDEPGIHLVQRGESVWSIAAALAGGDERRTAEFADQILDRNLGRRMADGQRFTNPAFIGIGWELLLPPGITATTTTAPADSTTNHAAAVERTYVVAEGDTLWAIADVQLGHGDRWSSIWSANAGATMHDGRVFDDPDLILPGWELRLPPAGGLDVAPTSAGAPPRPDPVEPELAGAVEPTPPIETSETAVASTINEGPAEAAHPDAAPDGVEPAPPAVEPDDAADDHPAVAAPGQTTAPPSSPASTTTTAAADVGEGASTTLDDPASTSPVRLEHAALLAAGILALIGVRRRARLRTATPRSRIPPPTAAHSQLERRLRVTQPEEQEARLDVAVRAASAALLATDARIGWVELSPSGEVRLQLTADATLPDPWIGDRARWELPSHIPLELIAAAARQVAQPCVAFVQIGATLDGAAVIVDLEACGSLTVEGPPDQARQITDAIVLGLATSLYAETANLVTVGIHDDAILDHRNAQRCDDLAEGVRHAKVLTTSISATDQSTFSLRARRTGGEAWEPTILAIGPMEEITTSAPDLTPEPGRGLAVVAAHPLEGAGGRLCCDRGTWTLRAFGCDQPLRPIGVDTSELETIAAVVQQIGTTEPADSFDATTDDLEWLQAPADDDGSDGYSEPDHAIEVRLLGSVSVEAATGERARFERSKTLELIAWLATHRSNSTRSGARTALWEIDVRDATFANVVSEARRGLARLVTPPNGVEWIPRTLTDELPLDHRVITDIDLVQHRVDHARVQPPEQAIATLRPAVERIAGMPFAGTSYLWPDAEGLASRYVLLAITASCELAAHALAMGDTDLVFWSTGRGLGVLPGHEELVGLRMRAHARAGDLAAVRDEWERYERIVLADPWSDGEPSGKLVELRRELLPTSGD